MGDKKLAMVALEDLGNTAARIFTQPSYVGSDFYFSGDQLTVDEIVSDISGALGIKCMYNRLDNESFRALGFPGAAELGNMF
jgi:uncharacterized protein YbjT (DUF2867 family)